MRQTALAAIVAAFLAASPGAEARASAQVSFGDMTFGGQTSGMSFGTFYFGQQIPGGSSFTELFPYTITIHADGEPAQRSWDSCLPLSVYDCGPAPTGSELVKVEFGTAMAREASPFTSYAFSGFPPTVVLDHAGSATYSGTLSITETVAPFGSYFPNTDSLTVWGASWIDANDVLPAVPEPGTAGLMLLGLGLLAAARRAR